MLLREVFQQLLTLFVSVLFTLLNPFFLIPAIIVIVVLVKKNKEYKKGAYYQITQLPYINVKQDTGRYGEYLTYKHLKPFEADGAKFLFNVYIPKEGGETTEIDVLMLSSKGVFVFESKNYSGWIFGSETQNNWYQTLPKGYGQSHKERFYNPIMQNQSHIKHLSTFLGEQLPTRSIIVFSDRCTLKNVQVSSKDISVINRSDVYSVVSAICEQEESELLTATDIARLYDALYPYTQVDENTKEQHITTIRNNLSNDTADNETATEHIVQSDPAPDVLDEKTHDATDGTDASAQNAEEPPLRCPRCNGELILRTATRGAHAGTRFYGCSNYPKCKYTQNL